VKTEEIKLILNKKVELMQGLLAAQEQSNKRNLG